MVGVGWDRSYLFGKAIGFLNLLYKDDQFCVYYLKIFHRSSS